MVRIAGDRLAGVHRAVPDVARRRSSARHLRPLRRLLLVGGDQVGVARVAGQQLGVGALVDDPAVARGRRPRRPARSWPCGRRPPRPSPPRRRSRRAGEDPRLDLGVDRGGRVVQHQQPRAGGPARGPARAAAAGRRTGWCRAPRAGCRGPSGSAATKPSAWAVRSAAHTVVVGDVGAERDVAADGVVEEERLLRHERGVLGERAGRQVAQVDAVEQHLARRRGRPAGAAARSSVDLPLAGGADDRDGAARARPRSVRSSQHGGPSA